MLKRFLPLQKSFFEFFENAAHTLVEAALAFHKLLLDLEHPEVQVEKIAALEEEGDRIAHITFELLHKTFITPFDRHDIHALTSRLDDVLDLINRCAQRFSFYGLKSVPAELISLAETGVKCAELLREAVSCLHSLKNSDKILNCCEAINVLESKAHKLVLAGEKDLFLQQEDFKLFFKLKEVYGWTKQVISGCQDAANTIKGIVLEYS